MSYEKVAQAKARVVIGMKQTLKAMKNGEVEEVLVADDADQAIKDKVMNVADQLQIPVKQVDSMKQLGRACGIDVRAATVAIKQ
ncbi:50S ribosomal protein L7ae-like protein [Thalassobacillus sp. CUG 92003]|uniref:50S ribosomal protein L7ae-like protein n=1 Tax=Thalassobacillus sp. CUG 92003 TaxID=2736641 RepID=UPI0015E726DE|nr:50S ribosomal protein L7ae-like protein [Thalassobacillus sp. CUG 92003]